MIVMKFGGSSLESAYKIRRCIQIVKGELNRRPLVVVSAHGQMTDCLVRMAKKALAGQDGAAEFKRFHLTLLDSLRLERDLVDDLLAQLETILHGVSLIRELTPKTLDHILSFGERASSVIIAAAAARSGLPAVAANAYDIGFLTDSAFGCAAPLPGIEEEIARRLGEIDGAPIITGFIGQDGAGNITTIGRNGSDYTASFIGAAVEAEDGYYRILGRIDDVINVSGHRLGTKEIESAALTVNEVAEAAVVPVAHDIKGKEPDLYVSLKPGFEATEALAQRISDAISSEIGKIAKPRKVWIVQDMPKTRSGKIMRRVLGAISNKNDVGDVTTLANPEIVEDIKTQVQK